MNNCKLVLYSGGQLHKNQYIHEELVKLVGCKKNISMTYVPYCNENHKTFYARAQKRYKKFGVTKFNCLPVDVPVDEKELSRVLKSDIIYLAGGNTFYFLKHLKKSKLFSKLKDFVNRGGVLAGLSAGGIIMTPHIELAGYPDFDVHADDNEVKLKNMKALNLVKFEFYPHYMPSAKLDRALKDYSLQAMYPVIACHDGSGVVIDGPNRHIKGEFKIFHKGVKF
jgi:dipeptidase E